MTAFEHLMSFQRETEALGQISGRLGWDQETVMPRGAAHQRSEEIGAISAILHARRTDPKVGAWLAEIDDSTLDVVGRAQMRHIRRSYDRASKVPADLAAEIARTTSLGHGIWAEARAKEDVAHFLPTLTRIIDLRRQEADALKGDGARYDALVQDYEPGMTGQMLEDLFAAMRPRLVALRDKVMGAPRPIPLTGDFDEAKQMKLARKLARTFGYDMARGRVDKAVHPFSSGSGDDVRITTRTAANDPFNCIYSTIHEVGHAAYEQAIEPAYRLTPVGAGVSMGVHESQSRIYENQLGRSRAFTSWLYAEMSDTFGDLGVANADAFYATVNRVWSGRIRTEADEVQYNLHILMRFDLERALIDGSLEAEDLEAAWNSRFSDDFGYAVDKPSNGVLQDVHWSAGLFGYFPTYTLGNVYAGCLHKALRNDVADLDAHLAKGELEPATNWLREKVQRHGGLFEPRAVIEAACDSPASEEPLLDYLEEKFGAIYGLH